MSENGSHVGENTQGGSVAEANERPLEEGIKTNLRDRLTYDGYLCLDALLSAQKPLSEPAHHDEMLFIIQHQTSELWMKLIVHELEAAIRYLGEDRPGPTSKTLSRIKQVQRQLFEQWAVLETLTPTEYAEFRDVLGHASGFQSLQYRLVEFLLGNKNAHMLKVFKYDPVLQQRLEDVLKGPSLYDQFLRYLSRWDHAIPGELLNRDVSQPHTSHSELLPVFARIYNDPRRFWAEYDLCEKLVDVEESFQLWRFRHMKTVERIIGYKMGTGGSTGVSFLKKALELTFFPELLEVRTHIG